MITRCSFCGHIVETVGSCSGISDGVGPHCAKKHYGKTLSGMERQHAIRNAVHAPDDSEQGRKLREYVEARR